MTHRKKTVRLLRALAAIAVVPATLSACAASGSGRAEPPHLTVLAAASLTEAFGELGDVYRAEHPGTVVDFSFGGSSSLVRQALDGAPAAVLATASPTNMQEAVDGGVTVGQPVVFARNSLTLVVPPGNPAGVTGLRDLADPARTVVMCAPEVPCGAAAVHAFEVAGLVAAPDSLEQDVKSVVAKVAADEADVGVVYVTDARAAADTTDEVVLPKPEQITTDYPIVELTGSAGTGGAASAFIALVRSPDGAAVLEKYGFQLP